MSYVQTPALEATSKTPVMRRASPKANIRKSSANLAKDVEPHPTQPEVAKTSRLKRFASKAKWFKSSSSRADFKSTCAEEIKSSQHHTSTQEGKVPSISRRQDERTRPISRHAAPHIKHPNSASVKVNELESFTEGKGSKILTVKHASPSKSSETSSEPAVKVDATSGSHRKRFASKLKFFSSSASKSSLHESKDEGKLSIMRRIAARANRFKSKFKSTSEELDEENDIESETEEDISPEDEFINFVQVSRLERSKMEVLTPVAEYESATSSDEESDDSGEDGPEYSSDEGFSDDSTIVERPPDPYSGWVFVPYLPRRILKKREPFVEIPKVEYIVPDYWRGVRDLPGWDFNRNPVKKWVRPEVKLRFPEYAGGGLSPLQKLWASEEFNSRYPQTFKLSTDSVVDGKIVPAPAKSPRREPAWYDDLPPRTRALFARDCTSAEDNKPLKVVSGEKYGRTFLTEAEFRELEKSRVISAVMRPCEMVHDDPEDPYPYVPHQVVEDILPQVIVSPLIAPLRKGGEACGKAFDSVVASTSQMFNGMFANFYSKKLAVSKKIQSDFNPGKYHPLASIAA